ncbi:MAG: hypothetical protein IIT61_08950, partial [Bacteroidales bacterium]|nr:hypothetical protein [Bacteroidales bacterium]
SKMLRTLHATSLQLNFQIFKRRQPETPQALKRETFKQRNHRNLETIRNAAGIQTWNIQTAKPLKRRRHSNVKL